MCAPFKIVKIIRDILEKKRHKFQKLELQIFTITHIILMSHLNRIWMKLSYM